MKIYNIYYLIRSLKINKCCMRHKGSHKQEGADTGITFWEASECSVPRPHHHRGWFELDRGGPRYVRFFFLKSPINFFSSSGEDVVGAYFLIAPTLNIAPTWFPSLLLLLSNLHKITTRDTINCFLHWPLSFELDQSICLVVAFFVHLLCATPMGTAHSMVLMKVAKGPRNRFGKIGTARS